MTKPILILALLLPLILAAPADDKMATVPVLPSPFRVSRPISLQPSIQDTST